MNALERMAIDHALEVIVGHPMSRREIIRYRRTFGKEMAKACVLDYVLPVFEFGRPFDG